MQPIIHAKNIAKTYSKIVKKGFWKDLLRPEFTNVNAVENLSLKINKGEAVAFLGPNGAGKTTTIKMLTGLIHPSSGTVEVMGHTPYQRSPELLGNIGLVMGSKNGLEWDLTPKQNYDLLKDIYQISDQDYTSRLNQLNAMLNTTKVMDTQVRKLSLGERMKSELIGAILHDPEIIFLDEPTVGLDITARNTIRNFLLELKNSSGITILLTSHDMDDVENICERLVVISEGHKVYDDRLNQLQQRYAETKFVKLTLSAGGQIEDLTQMIDEHQAQVVNTTPTSTTLSIKKDSLGQFLQHVAQLEVDDIDIIPVPLEKMIEDLF